MLEWMISYSGVLVMGAVSSLSWMIHSYTGLDFRSRRTMPLWIKLGPEFKGGND
jgi:hypothetical protein